MWFVQFFLKSVSNYNELLQVYEMLAKCYAIICSIARQRLGHDATSTGWLGIARLAIEMNAAWHEWCWVFQKGWCFMLWSWQVEVQVFSWAIPINVSSCAWQPWMTFHSHCFFWRWHDDLDCRSAWSWRCLTHVFVTSVAKKLQM